MHQQCSQRYTIFKHSHQNLFAPGQDNKKIGSHMLNNQYIHTRRNYRMCKRLEYLYIHQIFLIQ